MSGLAYRHQRVQRLRRLLGRRSARKDEGRFVIEGVNLLEEALSARARIEAVYIDGGWTEGLPDADAAEDPNSREDPSGAEGPGLVPQGSRDRLSGLLERCSEVGVRVFELEPGVLARVAGTVTPQPVIAVVETPVFELARLKAMSPRLVVVCVDVRDPGNAGTVARSAWAAGADAVVCCEGTVDLWNPKAVRSSAGAVFHLPIVSAGPATEVLTDIGEWGLRRVGTVSEGGADYAMEDLTARVAFIFGNEAAGLPLGELRAQLDGLVSIPMAGGAESLNVGMAAAVLCFEVARQRRYGAPERSGSLVALRLGQARGRMSGRMNGMSSDGGASLGELIAAVSHELRQPLASIRGLTEMMLGHWGDFSDDEKVQMLQGVLHDAERVGRLIDELLDVSRLESGQLALHRRATDVAALVARVVKNLKLSYPNLEATVDIGPQLPTVSVDPFKLEQVFSNVLENACKYGSPAGVHIAASHNPGPGAAEVEISVSDRGEGIAAEDLPHVTEKFYRGADGKPTGLGLGLWISKEIIEAHGGELVATSVAGEGTTVSFTIPLQEDARTGKLAGT